MNNKKRGQVTLFIILGLVVLIIIGVALFLVNQSKKQQPTESVYTQTYDARLAPIQNDITYCLQRLGTEATTKIGAGGGYLDPDARKYIYNMPIENSNNALELFSGSNMIVPYWLYIDSPPSCTTCSVKQAIPPLTGGSSSIQGQMQNYINSNIITCMDNFSAHKADLEITYGPPSSYVDFRDENVFLGLNWSVNVSFPDGTKSDSLKTYSSKIDVRLKKMYEFAVSVLYQTEMVQGTQNAEQFTKDMLAFYSFGAQDARIPPIGGPVVFETTAPKYWLLSDVKNTLKEAVSENTPYLQVQGTKDSFLYNDNDELGWNTYSKFNNVVYYNSSFESDVRVRFNYYPTWPMYVSIGPTHSEFILPESTSIDLWILKFGLTKYKFSYDIAYPLLVTFEDDSALGGKGFLFQYAYEVNLRNNDVYTNDTINLSALYKPADQGVTMGFEQRTVPVTLNVVDGYTSMPADNVFVKYKCLDQDYIVGVSATDKSGNAIINTSLPPCIGGAFMTSDPAYAESLVSMDTSIDQPIIMDYPVYQERTIELKVRKRMFEPTVIIAKGNEAKTVDRQWAMPLSVEAYASSTYPDENYMLIMTEKRDDGSDGHIVMFESKNNLTNITLTPGKYAVQLIDTMKFCNDSCKMSNLTIPGRTITEKKTTTTINDTVFNDTIYLGGVTLDNSTTGEIIITPADLQKHKMILYIASYDPMNLNFTEDLGVMGKVQEAATLHPELFKPEFE